MRNGRVNRLIGETGKIVMSVNRIKTIIETFLGSDMPGEVQQRFAEWLRDPASRDEKERALENYWNGLRAEEPGGRERKLERLHEAMRRGERFRVRRIWRNVAAAAAVVLLAAGTNYVVVKDYLRTKIETNIVTSAHDKGEYVLPDGTHIWLNAGSVLRYYGDLTGRRRVVELDGEGFFKVRHDADRPFILQMEDMNIEVLGTEFDVINYAEFATTEAILCNGSIRAYGGRDAETRRQAGVRQEGGARLALAGLDAQLLAVDGRLVVVRRHLAGRHSHQPRTLVRRRDRRSRGVDPAGAHVVQADPQRKYRGDSESHVARRGDGLRLRRAAHNDHSQTTEKFLKITRLCKKDPDFPAFTSGTQNPFRPFRPLPKLQTHA